MRWRGHEKGLDAHIVASNLSPQIVAIARDQAAGVPGVTIERVDALALPHPDGSFDLTLCTLALHHFDAPLAAELLAEMARVGRQAVVFDLVRSPLAWWACLLMTHTLANGPNDAAWCSGLCAPRLDRRGSAPAGRGGRRPAGAASAILLARQG